MIKQPFVVSLFVSDENAVSCFLLSFDAIIDKNAIYEEMCFARSMLGLSKWRRELETPWWRKACARVATTPREVFVEQERRAAQAYRSADAKARSEQGMAQGNQRGSSSPKPQQRLYETTHVEYSVAFACVCCGRHVILSMRGGGVAAYTCARALIYCTC